MSLLHWTMYFGTMYIRIHKCSTYSFIMSLCPINCEEPYPRFSNDPDGIKLWAKLSGCSCVSASVKAARTRDYNQPNKSMLHSRQLSILQQRSAFRFLLLIESCQPHTSSAPPHFIVHRPRNAFRIVLLHTWPKKSTLVDH